MSIKELRIKKGFSQEQLAEHCNLSSRTIQRIEKDNKASCESLVILAKVFELEVKELEDIMYKKTSNIQENKEKKYNTFLSYLKNNNKTTKFLFINIFLIILNLSTNSENLWFPYILIGWGFFHFYKRFIEYKELK
jgi:transcriptional regulator with XRE-family HTH domain